MKIDDFLEQFVEGYLLSDLETMSHDNVAAGKRFGAVGYPMMTTLFAGMELLGGLLTPLDEAFTPDAHGSDKFVNFWDNYFCTEHETYIGLGHLIYALIRNGVAHTNVAKHGVVIHKYSGQTIKVNLDKSEIYVDPNVLFREFESTYLRQVKTISDKSAMQERLNQIEAAYAKKSKSQFDNLPTLDPSIVFSDSQNRPLDSTHVAQIVSSGASGALGPIGDIPIISTTATTVPFTTPSGTLPTNGSS